MMIKKYFLRGNTAQGEATLVQENMKGICDILVIKGKCKKAANRLLTRMAFLLDQKDYAVDGIMNPDDIGAYEGLILPKDKIAIFHENCARGIKGEEISTDEYLKGKLELSENSEELLIQKRNWAYENMYISYGEAKKIHDLWEKIYVNNMDFSALNNYTDGVISQLISKRRASIPGIRRTGFFGASTPDGAVNYIEPLTEDLSSRYFIKGRPGTGKSTFLKKFASCAENMGYDTEVYYCSFDKNSLDMVIVRDLSLGVFDSTAPHELFPARNGDGILDFYTQSGLFGIDEKYSKELADISEKYSHKLSQGRGYLRLGTAFSRELEYYYGKLLDENEICILADKLLRSFL